jgi:hypothetical protein
MVTSQVQSLIKEKEQLRKMEICLQEMLNWINELVRCYDDMLLLSESNPPETAICNRRFTRV